jgi:hypothetical protein
MDGKGGGGEGWYLTCGTGFKGFEENICDTLRSQDISSDNGSSVGRTQERSLGDFNRDRF